MSSLSDLPKALRVQRTVQVLARSLERGRLGHALLFFGEEEASVSAVAEALARGLLGASDLTNHLDCFTLRPSKKSRAIVIGDADNPDPNTVRHLLREVYQSPRMGARKVAIIHECDRLNLSAANAFLKTLEEPPADTTLLLTTTRPYDLLPTIRSRCLGLRIGTSGTPAPVEPGWQAWSTDFARWLGIVQAGEATGADAVLLQYGLITRFGALVEAGAELAWQAQKDRLPETMDEDERAAHREGLARGERARALATILQATLQFAREQPELPVLALGRSVQALERTARLISPLNLREESALEAFFLETQAAFEARA